jgi:hypothetical protein
MKIGFSQCALAVALSVAAPSAFAGFVTYTNETAFTTALVLQR